jgi:hypothetical protein
VSVTIQVGHVVVHVQERHVPQGGHLWELANPLQIRRVQRYDEVERGADLLHDRLGTRDVAEALGNGVCTGHGRFAAHLAQGQAQTGQAADGVPVWADVTDKQGKVG